ncbi:MAG: 3-oxoacyl-[acyl-carrier-protein] reductase [Chloroflexi bacterium]|nr:3-oxoacyl-[acyl-carrier-protein] reductase [Chloroflexota bacterium]
MTGLAGKVALVTGSGRGIGRAVALRLAQDGAALAISDVDAAGGQAVVQELQGQGRQAQFYPADVAAADQVNQLVDRIMADLGGLHVLVNNAGITRDALLLRMSDEDWDRVLTVNLKGAFLCTRAALRPMLRQRWGRIINIASVVGLVGNAGQANYAASKAGLVGLSKATAKEAASRGVTVNAIAPGFIDTAMTKGLKEELKQEILKQIPLGRLGQPEDIAAAVAFLASEEARYITGHVLCVDGGLTMV